MKDRSKNNAIRTIVCPTCNKTVTRRMPASVSYCSRQCGLKAPRPNRKTGENHNCLICQKELYIQKHRLGLKGYFCCKEHANEYQGRNKTKHICKTCGVEFRRSPCWVKYGEQKYCGHDCRYADPEETARLIALNIQQQNTKINRFELAGYKLLDSMELLYFQQYLIANKFCVDAFFFSSNLIIQFDGDYWHGNPNKFSEPDYRQKKRMNLDKSQDAYMKKCGYQVLRIWESEMKKDIEAVKQRILTAL